MENYKNCPVCLTKFKNSNLLNTYLHVIKKKSSFVEKTCSKNMSHYIQFYYDIFDKRVEHIKISLNYKYSEIVEVDYYNNFSKISYIKNNKHTVFEIPELLLLDFPSLVFLKDKISKLSIYL